LKSEYWRLFAWIWCESPMESPAPSASINLLIGKGEECDLSSVSFSFEVAVPLLELAVVLNCVERAWGYREHESKAGEAKGQPSWLGIGDRRKRRSL
jgi:hypothetical protein